MRFDVSSIFRWRNKRLDNEGREIGDPVPMSPPVGYTPELSMIEIVRQQIRGEHLRLAALNSEMETFEEADDFEVSEGDEIDIISPWEEQFDPVESAVRSRLRQDEHEARYTERLASERLARDQRNGITTADVGDERRMADVSGGSGDPDAIGVSEPKSREKPASKSSVRAGKTDDRSTES